MAEEQADSDIPVATRVSNPTTILAQPELTTNLNNNSSIVTPVTASLADTNLTRIDGIDYSDCDKIDNWFNKYIANKRYTIYKPTYRGLRVTGYIELGKYTSYSPAKNTITFTNGTYVWDKKNPISLFYDRNSYDPRRGYGVTKRKSKKSKKSKKSRK